MASLQYSLSWDSYKSNLCKGFAELQQRQEFVDMTLVAEGHLVKVHKNLICLASPFIKQIIVAVPCEHPIIFLNNVSHETLCYLLEYLYTGEVKVEVDQLQNVLKAAKDLKLCGLENVMQNSGRNGDDAFVVQKDKEVDDSCMEEFVTYDRGPSQSTADQSLCDIAVHCDDSNSVHMTDDDGAVDRENIEVDGGTQQTAAASSHPVNAITIQSAGTRAQQYSVTSRGSLQLLLHRYMYLLHHQALCGRKRRWRCLDYRRARCAAYVDTLDDAIVARKNCHTHPHHDEKILKKIRAKQVFGTLGTAIHGARELNKTDK